MHRKKRAHRVHWASHLKTCLRRPSISAIIMFLSVSLSCSLAICSISYQEKGGPCSVDQLLPQKQHRLYWNGADYGTCEVMRVYEYISVLCWTYNSTWWVMVFRAQNFLLQQLVFYSDVKHAMLSICPG